MSETDISREELFEQVRLLQGQVIELKNDILKLKESEQALRNSNVHFKELFDNMTSGVAIYEAKEEGRDFIFKDINKSGELNSKLSRDQIIGKSVLEVFPGVKEIGLFEAFSRVWKTGEPQHCPISFYHDGRVSQWVANYVYKLPSGEIVAVYDDVTELKKAEEERQQREQEMSSMLKSMINAFVVFESVFDDAGNFISYRFVYINTAYEIITGVKYLEVSGKTVHEVWPETEPEWVKRYGEVAVTGKSQEFELYHSPTKKIYHCNVYRPFQTKEKFCVIFEDITERKKAEEALLFNNIILRTQQESSIDGILIVNEKGEILSFNQRFVDMWGIPPDVIETKSDQHTLESVMSKLDDPEEFIAKVQHLYAVRDEVCADVVALKDGRFFERYSAPMLDSDKKYYGRVWYFRDITERRNLEEESRKRLQELEIFYRASLGREDRIIELKEEIVRLKKKLGNTS